MENNRRNRENAALDAAKVVLDHRGTLNTAIAAYTDALADGNPDQIHSCFEAMHAARLCKIGAEIEFRKAVITMAEVTPDVYSVIR